MGDYFGFQTMTSTPRTFPEMELVDVQVITEKKKKV